jgi:two-component system chemotaxis response regulator CheY
MAEYSTLIIDDDIWMQRILSKSLQSYGFKKTFLASNGFEGIALAVENLPNLIILDILMPDLSGIQTLKVLKTIKATRQIPILMVSALSDAENLGLAVRSGSAGFISKPFTRATIYDKLVEVFGKEKLLQIARGEAFSEIHDSFDKVKELERNATALWNTPQSDAIPNTEENTQTVLNPAELNKVYQPDEKQTLESIKKMLLRTKK